MEFELDFDTKFAVCFPPFFFFNKSVVTEKKVERRWKGVIEENGLTSQRSLVFCSFL